MHFVVWFTLTRTLDTRVEMSLEEKDNTGPEYAKFVHPKKKGMSSSEFCHSSEGDMCFLSDRQLTIYKLINPNNDSFIPSKKHPTILKPRNFQVKSKFIRIHKPINCYGSIDRSGSYVIFKESKRLKFVPLKDIYNAFKSNNAYTALYC